jgi:integrase
MADNLIQKKGESTWYVRLAVPADLQSALGCTSLTQSLKTGLRSQAMERRLSILGAWKALFAEARAARTSRGDAWKEPVADFAGSFAKAIRKLKADVAMDEREEPATLTHEEFLAIRGDVFTDTPQGRANREKAERVFAMTGIEAELATLDLAKEFASQMMGRVFTATHDLSPDEQKDMALILADPKAHRPASPITTARLKAFREFRETQKGAPKHIDQQVGRMERLSAFLKESSLPLDFDSVRSWILSLDKAPATLEQHLMSGTAFWKWAVRYDPVFREEYEGKANPFKGHDIPQGGGRETSGEQRETYTIEQLENLHRGAIEVGNDTLADLILLGAYTGSRIDQLCNLKVERIIEQDGITSFDFRKGKNKQAARIVPVHPAIQELVQRLVRNSNDGFMVPTTADNKYNSRSTALSKAFGNLKKKQGFGPLHVFHSMRNTVITNLVRANVPDFIIKEIVGHITGSVTHDVYSHGASAQQKFDAICKLPTLKV